jgi:predicted phage-related endonuclease
MASDDVKTREEPGKRQDIARSNWRHARRIGLNGDDAIEVAALSGRDAAELEHLSPSRAAAKVWNQMET